MISVSTARPTPLAPIVIATLLLSVPTLRTKALLPATQFAAIAVLAGAPEVVPVGLPVTNCPTVETPRAPGVPPVITHLMVAAVGRSTDTVTPFGTGWNGADAQLPRG